MKTTIKDISNYTGLSITTVSLVLNNKPSKISEKTKKRVIAAAKKLNYSPNHLAVGLVTKCTQTLGLIVTDISNNFYGILAKGVERACQEKGWNVMLCNSLNSHERELDLIRVLKNKSVDGIIYCVGASVTRAKAKKSFDLLKSGNLPLVAIDNDFIGLARHNIYLDNKMGGYIATKYLIENGHSKIACITGPKGIDMKKGRIEGYMQALKEASIPYNSKLVIEGNYTIESGFSAIERLKNKDFSVVFAFNDMMAIGALKALKEMKIKVPDDISLMGYDDLPFCEVLEVPLTTIKQPVYEMGYTAAEKLIKLIQNEDEGNLDIMFEPTLMVRNSIKRIIK